MNAVDPYPNDQVAQMSQLEHAPPYSMTTVSVCGYFAKFARIQSSVLAYFVPSGAVSGDTTPDPFTCASITVTANPRLFNTFDNDQSTPPNSESPTINTVCGVVVFGGSAEPSGHGFPGAHPASNTAAASDIANMYFLMFPAP